MQISDQSLICKVLVLIYSVSAGQLKCNRVIRLGKLTQLPLQAETRVLKHSIVNKDEHSETEFPSRTPRFKTTTNSSLTTSYTAILLISVFRRVYCKLYLNIEEMC